MENQSNGREEETFPFSDPKIILAWLAEGGSPLTALRHVSVLAMRGSSASALITIILHFARENATYRALGYEDFKSFVEKESQQSWSGALDQLSDLTYLLEAGRTFGDYHSIVSGIGRWTTRELRTHAVPAEQLDKTVEHLVAHKLNREEVRAYLGGVTNGTSTPTTTWKNLRLPVETHEKLVAVLADLKEKFHLKGDPQSIEALCTHYWATVS